MIVIFAFLGFVLTKKGANWRACLATLLGCFFAWIGLIFEPLKILYDYAWFVGFGVSFLTHWILMTAFPLPEETPSAAAESPVEIGEEDAPAAAEEISVAEDDAD
jgi:NCS1 family nucleobase:cation symporter-1